jgi:hypothetical protein
MWPPLRQRPTPAWHPLSGCPVTRLPSTLPAPRRRTRLLRGPGVEVSTAASAALARRQCGGVGGSIVWLDRRGNGWLPAHARKPQKVRYNFCTTSLRALPEEHARLDDGPTLAAREVLCQPVRRRDQLLALRADNGVLPSASADPGDGALLLHDSTVARFDAISADHLHEPVR